jgi:hypothetical protein
LSLAAACGGGAVAVRTASAPKQPAWIAKVTSSPDALWFVGAKEGAGTLDEGKAAALDSAQGQAAQYVGVKIRAAMIDVQSTDVADNVTRQKTTAQAQALIRSAEIADTYWEKLSREGYDRYDVWVLVRLPRAEVEKERARQDAQRRQSAVAALARLREGTAEEQNGALLAALARYRDAATQAKDLDADVPTGDTEVATAGAVRRRADDAAGALQGRVRRAVIVGPDWVAGALTKGLSSKGFSARVHPDADERAALRAAAQDGTPWVIVVRATTAPGGSVFQQVSASASLDVRALDARSGAVVAAAQKQAKGFGRTPDAAVQAAASEAGQGAGSELASALAAREGTVP